MKPTKLLLLLMMILIVGAGIASVSDYVHALQPLGSRSPSAGSPIVSDQFIISGIRGSGFCDQINLNQISADQRGVNAGVIHVMFRANASVSFWMFNPLQYRVWQKNGTTCGSRLEVPSVLTVASRSNYDNSSIQVPKTDNYYFIFDNRNPGPVSVSFEVDYPIQVASTTTSLSGSDTVLNARFNLIGISGTHSGCIYNDNYYALVTAGQVSVSYSSTGGPVDFWIMNQAEHGGWKNAKGCSAMEVAPSIYTAIGSYGYSGIVSLNATGTYYFAFANFNQGNVSITLSVNYVNPTNEKPVTDIGSLLTHPQLLAAQLSNYWQQVLGAAATGMSVILGWLFKTRKRRFLTGYMSKIDSTFTEYAVNREECRTQLNQMKEDIVKLLKKGKIDESHFTILDDKITQYLRELN